MIQPETPTERVTIIVLHLAKGNKMSISDVMGKANIKRAGAYALMARVSRVAPLVLDDGKWSLLSVYSA